MYKENTTCTQPKNINWGFEIESFGAVYGEYNV